MGHFQNFTRNQRNSPALIFDLPFADIAQHIQYTTTPRSFVRTSSSSYLPPAPSTCDTPSPSSFVFVSTSLFIHLHLNSSYTNTQSSYGCGEIAHQFCTCSSLSLQCSLHYLPSSSSRLRTFSGDRPTHSPSFLLSSSDL